MADALDAQYYTYSDFLEWDENFRAELLDGKIIMMATPVTKYQQAGVKEYWIVDPDSKSVQVCILNKGQYIVSMYEENDIAPISVLKDCKIDLHKVFEESIAL